MELECRVQSVDCGVLGGEWTWTICPELPLTPSQGKAERKRVGEKEGEGKREGERERERAADLDHMSGIAAVRRCRSLEVHLRALTESTARRNASPLQSTRAPVQS